MLENKIFTINSLKFDGKVHRSWKAELTEEKSDLISFKGIFDEEIKHNKLGVIRRGTISYEFYWKTRWFNIFRFHEPEGNLRNFYCNVNQPPTLEKNVLNYVDLDVDVLVWKDFSFEILDLEEFEANAKKFQYTNRLRANVDKSLGEILEMVKNKNFPFDFKS